MVVLVQFESPVSGEDGRAYIARVCGRQAADNMWEGWIEFDPGSGAPVLRTPRETTQPNKPDLEYWATGLTEAYLEGALERAMHPEVPVLRPRTVNTRPTYDGPAPAEPTGRATATTGKATGTAAKPAHAILNPFEVHAQGEDLLREELGALDEGHLRNILRAHDLISDEDMDLLALRRPALVDLIVAAVRRRVG
ncbi:MAG TPA: hypothetical protein VK933_11910 [Longimicrobiales bacterium]|nr:hypothetical protein [Longimicrobiales bacterium]